MSDSTAASFTAAVAAHHLEPVLEIFERRVNNYGGGVRPDPLTLIIRDVEQAFNPDLIPPNKMSGDAKGLRAFNELRRSLDFEPPTAVIRDFKLFAEAHAVMMAEAELNGLNRPDLASRARRFKLAEILAKHAEPATLLAQRHFSYSSYQLRGDGKGKTYITDARPYLMDALGSLYRARNAVFTRPGLTSLWSYHAAGLEATVSATVRELYFSISGVTEEEWESYLAESQSGLDSLEVAILVKEAAE